MAAFAAQLASQVEAAAAGGALARSLAEAGLPLGGGLCGGPRDSSLRVESFIAQREPPPQVARPLALIRWAMIRWGLIEWSSPPPQVARPPPRRQLFPSLSGLRLAATAVPLLQPRGTMRLVFKLLEQRLERLALSSSLFSQAL